MNKIITAVYSAVHFIVDLSCIVLVSNLITQKTDSPQKLFFSVIIYDFFAFALQLPIGIIADKVNKNGLCSALGCLLAAFAYAFSGAGLAACIIAGIGNATFHIGGGIDVLNISKGRAAPSGVFVSTGAMGVFLGAWSAKIGFDKYYIPVILLILSAAALIVLYLRIKDSVKNEELSLPRLGADGAAAVICLFLTVCIRSYVGMILSFEWKSSFALALLSVAAVVLGKMLGGFVGDKIGFEKISLISLPVSAVFFVFAFKVPALGIAAMLLFNMTMPITLSALGNIFNKAKGLAFGLTTLALFLGALPKFSGHSEAFTPVGLCVITLVSAAVMYVGLRKYNGFAEKNND